MSLPPYPEYKDSGVEWLGEVPKHWGTARLRWLSTRYSGGTPDKLNLDYWTEGRIPWINSGAVNQSLVSEPSAYITEAAFENSSAKWIPTGALVMALAGQGKTKGMVAQLAIPTTCNQSMAAIIPNQELAARFLFWWLNSNYQNIRNMAGGDLRDGLNLELLGNIACPLAPFSEQQTIAAFLDRETGKIDVLIAEQQRLVELLAEKRQAVISHAVIKGLNPNAPMKDSGIEWLGEVPAHWEVKRLGTLFREVSEEGEANRPILSVSIHDGVSDRELDDKELDRKVTRSEDRGKYKSVEPGDLVYNMMRAWQGGFGTVKVVGMVSPAYVVARPCYCFETEFVEQQLRSPQAVEEMRRFSRGVTDFRLRLYWDEFKSISVALAPKEEQQTIATFLESETAKFDTLTAEANRAIALLQERRSALISAAVTGKIDVRNRV